MVSLLLQIPVRILPSFFYYDISWYYFPSADIPFGLSLFIADIVFV